MYNQGQHTHQGTLCIICGKAGGDLKCQLGNHQKKGQEVYTTFLEVVHEFNDTLMKIQVDNTITTEVLVINRHRLQVSRNQQLCPWSWKALQPLFLYMSRILEKQLF